MDTAVCKTDVELGVTTHDKVVELYYQNRKFGFYLTRLISQRLLDNYSSLRDRTLNEHQGATTAAGGGAVEKEERP